MGRAAHFITLWILSVSICEVPASRELQYSSRERTKDVTRIGGVSAEVLSDGSYSSELEVCAVANPNLYFLVKTRHRGFGQNLKTYCHYVQSLATRDGFRI